MRRVLAGIGTAALLTGCVPTAGIGGGPDTEPLPAPGTGTLRQDQVTVQLTSGQLQIKVTPLAESVIRTTAPDTYRLLSGLAGRYMPDAVQETGSDAPALFLVSFYSEDPDVSFVPEEIQLLSQGMRLRPDAILPVTPSWGQRRVAQRETETAVYAFADGVDLESELVVAYGLVESGQWQVILPRVRAERARARARSGG
jgi:hypothetical protein